MSAEWPPPDADAKPRVPEDPPGPYASPAEYAAAPNGVPPYPAAPNGVPRDDQPWPYPPPQWGPPQQWAPPAQWGPPPPGAYPPPPAAWTTAPPQRLADLPPPRPPHRAGWVIALSSVVGVVLLGLVAVLALPSLQTLQRPGTHRPAPNASSPTSTSTSSPKPTSSPSATMPTGLEDILKKNPIYAIKVPADCPAQRIPSSKAAFRTQVKALVSCENKAWQKAMASTPVAFVKPKVVFYNASISSPCGQLGTRYPAAYCTGDRTLYFSTAAYAQGRYYRLAVAQFVMHEYAHHIQELAEIFDSESVMDEKSAVTTRRIELQAHCMAHYQLTHSDIGFDAQDRSDAEFQFSYTTDAKGHGSATAERYWGRRGLSGSKIGACNTWTVPASRVK